MNAINLEHYQTVNQSYPHEGTSNIYSFIPTTRVVNVLKKENWYPVSVKESGVNKNGMTGFQKHLIRFRNDIFSKSVPVGGCIPEIAITNSHNAKASFQITIGLFKLICSNGLIVSEGTFETHRIRHIGYNDEDVFAALSDAAEKIPVISNGIKQMTQIILKEKEKEAYAEAAMQLHWDKDSKSKPEPVNLLQVRRKEDEKDDLFTVFNVVQENMTKGIRYHRLRTKKKKRNIRGITSIDTDIKLNKALWTLTRKMIELKN